MKRENTRKAILTGLFIVICVIYLMPIITVLMNSFKTNSAINTETFAFPNAEAITQGYFTNATLVAGVLGAGAIALAVRSPRVRTLYDGWGRETTARRVGWMCAAALLIVAWLLHALQTEGTVFNADPAVAYHQQFTLDETFAVLNGRTPLVDFVAQYGSLWP